MLGSIAFLNSSFLLGLLASFVPLLIYLLNRQRARTISFSSVSLLRQLEQSRMRQIRIRQWLLLILRSLIIFFAALALARPALRDASARAVGASARTSAVLLVDYSCSMRYEADEGTLLDLAKAKALKVAELFREADEVYLVPFADGPDGTGRPAADLTLLGNAIATLEPTYRSTDVGGAVKHAANLLEGADSPNREVYLFTDMTAAGWPTPEDSLGGEGITFYVVDLSVPDRRNLSVAGVDVADQVLQRGKPLTVEGIVANHGEKEVNSCWVDLYLEGQRVRQLTLDLPAGRRLRASFHAPAQAAGRRTGFAEIAEGSVGQDDRLLGDNRAFLAFEVPKQAQVLLVGPQDDDTYFLRRALNPRSDPEAFVQVAEVKLEGLRPEDIAQKDVLILSNVPRLSPSQLQAVRQHVAEGGALILFLGPDVDARFYNVELLPGIMPVKLEGPLGVPGGSDAYYAWQKVDFEHPIFRDLVEPERLDLPHFEVVYDLVALPEARPLIRYTTGGVALAEFGSRAGTCVLLASAVRLDWTDLPRKGIFVPLLYRTIQYLTAKQASQRSALVGQTPTRTLRSDFSGEALSLVDPTGGRTALMPTLTSDGYQVSLGALDQPGIWRLFADGRQIDAFAVNLDPAESDPQLVEPERVERMLGAHRTRILPGSAVIEAGVLQSRYGTELWKACLAVAFFLMIVEMVVARTRRNELPAEGPAHSQPA